MSLLAPNVFMAHVSLIEALSNDENLPSLVIPHQPSRGAGVLLDDFAGFELR